jgi:hypothetical protein
MEPPPLPGTVVGIADEGNDYPVGGVAAASPPTDGGTGSHRYFAVRRGGTSTTRRSGTSIRNAIFLHWADAESHVTGSNAASAEYDAFDNLEDAASYLVAGGAPAAAAAAGDKRKRTNADDDDDYEEEEETAKKTSKRTKSNKRIRKKKAVSGRMAREPTEKWNLLYDRLVHYHATHGGSTRIDPSDKSNDDLRKWLVNQRSQLNQSLTKAEGESLSPHLQSKIDRFEALGVDIRNSNRRLQYAARWDEMYAKLCAYKDAHGDCLVPTEKTEYGQLATWVYQQQKEYRKFKEGKGNSSKLTADHVVKLNDIGFVFERREKFLSWEGELNLWRVVNRISFRAVELGR